jgi:hypothetical protein
VNPAANSAGLAANLRVSGQRALAIATRAADHIDSGRRVVATIAAVGQNLAVPAAAVAVAATLGDRRMITHIVLFRPRTTLTNDERRTILNGVAATVKGCPTVRRCRVGQRVRHGLPGYEQAMGEDYEFALILEFDDVEGLRGYLTHPDHLKVGEFFTSAAAAALAYDYDLRDLNDLRLP